MEPQSQNAVFTVAPKPPMSEILRLLGYKKGKTRISDELQRSLEQQADQAATWIRARGCWLLSKVTQQADEMIHLDCGITLAGQTTATVFAHAEQIVLAGITLGEELDKRTTDNFQKGNNLEAVVLDAIGSAAIEDAAEQFHAELCSNLTNNQIKATGRISPGYGDIPIQLQPQLLHCIEATRINLTVTPSLMLTPLKSITFLFALGESVSERKGITGCKSCTRYQCKFRRFEFDESEQ